MGAVDSQCVDRRPNQVIFWSCRCGNAQGTTGDGARYCGCPSGTRCTPAIATMDTSADDLGGEYCLPPGAAFSLTDSCSATCDPVAHPCD